MSDRGGGRAESVRRRKARKEGQGIASRVPGSEAEPPGRHATLPWRIPARGWWQILRRTWREIGNDNIPLLSGGAAYYALLSVFPALIAVVTIYGLIADPSDVEALLSSASRILPENVTGVIRTQLQDIVGGSNRSLGWGLAASLAGFLWAASSGVLALIRAINIAYGERETRSFISLRVRGLLFALGAILFLTLSIGFITALPSVIGALDLGPTAARVVVWMRWPVLGFSVIAALGLIYRYGPDRNPARWSWVSWGAVLAAALWLAASLGFSSYVKGFGSFNKTYGTLGAVIVLLLWFYISAFVVLLGAEFNSEMEHQTQEDTPVGPPLPRGQRGAFVADYLPGEDRGRGSRP